ncbi:MAG: TIGR02452 family protein [Verrucomicrobia bacterium]|nr:TIGR02452 family protein [Verrucomicrobiota bacterium]
MSSSPLPIDRSREIVHVTGPHINDLGGSEEPPRWWPCIRNALAVLATIFTLGLAYIFSSTIRSYVDMTFTTPQPAAPGRTPLPPARLPQAPPAAARPPQAPPFAVPHHNRFQGGTYEERKALFRDTLHAVDHGYRVGSVVVTPDRDRTVRETASFRALLALSPAPGARQAKFVVSQKTTTQAILDLARDGVKPLALNKAHSKRHGGGVEDGCPAQEECMCRETSLYRSLEAHASKGLYPIPEHGGIYSGHVQVIRDPTQGFAFLEKPVDCSFASVAAYDLREGRFSNRAALGLPLTGDLSEATLRQNERYMDGSREKIVQLLRKAVLEGHTHLVLGALGCGAFEGSPTVTAQLFFNALNSSEFIGRFVRVEFAIYCAPGSGRDAANLAAFQQVFHGTQA